jgi:hypothetical protein
MSKNSGAKNRPSLAPVTRSLSSRRFDKNKVCLVFFLRLFTTHYVGSRDR